MPAQSPGTFFHAFADLFLPEDSNARAKVAAAAAVLDESVGNLVDALREHALYDNTARLCFRAAGRGGSSGRRGVVASCRDARTRGTVLPRTAVRDPSATHDHSSSHCATRDSCVAHLPCRTPRDMRSVCDALPSFAPRDERSVCGALLSSLAPRDAHRCSSSSRTTARRSARTAAAQTGRCAAPSSRRSRRAIRLCPQALVLLLSRVQPRRRGASGPRPPPPSPLPFPSLDVPTRRRRAVTESPIRARTRVVVVFARAACACRRLSTRRCCRTRGAARRTRFARATTATLAPPDLVSFTSRRANGHKMVRQSPPKKLGHRFALL